MKKARSRLIKKEKKETRWLTPTKPIIKNYWSHLPTLLVGFIFYALLYLILIKIYPQNIQHWLIPNMYLPLQVVFFIGNFFFFSFLFLNSRRGMMTAFILSLWLFFKLLKVTNYQFFFWISLSASLILESLIILLKRKRKSLV
jgi:hypothetical protein